MMIKYVLVFQICSIINGQCLTPLTDDKIIDSWIGCVEKGQEITMKIVEADPIRFENLKLIVKYWCNEDNSHKIPTSSKQFEKEI